MRSDANQPRVLVLTPTGRDGPASAALLQQAGLFAVRCVSMPNLLHELSAGADAALIAEEALRDEYLGPLTAWVEQQPPWSDMPFVVLTSRRDHPVVAEWRERLMRALRNVSLLERPVQAITLLSTAQAAVRARMRQYQVREHLAERNDVALELERLVAERTRELEQANLELRAQMAERAKVEESLRHAQKLEAIGQLTGGVAHDFNNLLMVISGGLELLGNQAEPARRARLMAGMSKAVARGTSLTRQLLAFSRRQALRPQVINLRDHIANMREMLDRSLRGDVEVALELPPDLWTVETDAGELELAVLNLTVNARDAMPSGGIITIRAENLPDLNDRELRGDYVRVSVIDTGTGIPPETMARIFEPFFTTKEVGKGSGLGLAQVYGFAKQSGGAIRTESAVGCGTTFRLLLPRSTARVEMVRPSQAGSTTRSPMAGHVLLVEDDDEVATLVAEMLGQLGLNTTRACSATAALGVLAEGCGVDVMFSDVMMPGGMNGLELARDVKRRWPDLPVLLTTAYADAVKGQVAEAGVEVLAKPYSLDDLAAAMRALLEQASTGHRAGQGGGVARLASGDPPMSTAPTADLALPSRSRHDQHERAARGVGLSSRDADGGQRDPDLSGSHAGSRILT